MRACISALHPGKSQGLRGAGERRGVASDARPPLLQLLLLLLGKREFPRGTGGGALGGCPDGASLTASLQVPITADASSAEAGGEAQRKAAASRAAHTFDLIR